MIVKDIKVFIDFASFYWHFIQGFSRIAIILILILKSIIFLELALKMFIADSNEVVKDDSNAKANKTFKNFFKSKKSKNITYIKAMKKTIFLIVSIKNVFNRLW